jgi:hypothetical protein
MERDLHEELLDDLSPVGNIPPGVFETEVDDFFSGGGF